MEVTEQRDACDPFHFEPQEVAHIPRAWERVPKIAFASRHKGRKIYKRQIAEDGKEQTSASEDKPERELKRQCLNNLPAVPAKINKQRHYTPTLREQRPGTPRRKPATRKSLRISERKSLSPRKTSPQKRSPNKEVGSRRAHPLTPIKKSRKRKSLPAASAYVVSQKSRRSLPLFSGLVALERTPEGRQDARANYDTEDAPTQVIGNSASDLVLGEDIQGEQDDAQTSALSLDSIEETGANDSDMGSNHSTPAKSPSPKKLRRLSRSMNDSLLETAEDFQPIDSPPLEQQNEVEEDDSDDLSSLDASDDDINLDVPIPPVTPKDEVNDEATLEQYLEVASLSELFRSPEKAKQAVLLQQLIAEENYDNEDISEKPLTNLLSAPDQNLSEYMQSTDTNGDADGENDTAKRKAGGRVSNDTSELLDFLQRVQSKKEAEAKQLAAEVHADSADAEEHESPKPPTPCGSPRKALAALNSNSPSPTGASLIDASEQLVQTNDDEDELATDVKPNRRSMRALITQRRQKQGTPIIPLRHRPDGTNPVLLQSRASAELAMLTRTNTKRNKGQAKMPQAMLEILKTKELSPVKKGTKQSEKTKKEVDWDETLVYFQEDGAKDEVTEVKIVKEGKKGKKLKEAKKGEKEDEGEEKDGKGAKNIKLKRRQGLGVLNGTPAPKKTGSKKMKAAEVEKEKKKGEQEEERKEKEKEERKEKKGEQKEKVACRIPTPRKATRAAKKVQ
ncbi:hypothetical protein MMC10_005479 [Thelotrema lepadinum]|nr:hypothetical protein [Thelotrema lepadinum]